MAHVLSLHAVLTPRWVLVNISGAVWVSLPIVHIINSNNDNELDGPGGIVEAMFTP